MIILCFGKGGHSVQAMKFNALLPTSFEGKVVYVTDSENLDIPVHIKLKEDFPKHKKVDLKNLFLNFLFSLKLFFYRFRGAKLMVTFGPGVCLIPALLWWLSGGKLVHFESWSRFYTASKTTKLISKFADKTFVQNETLLNEVKRSIFRGRL